MIDSETTTEIATIPHGEDTYMSIDDFIVYLYSCDSGVSRNQIINMLQQVKKKSISLSKKRRMDLN